MTTRVVLFVVCAISASIWQRFSGDCPALLIAVFVPRMCARCVYCSYSGAPSAAALGGDVWCRAALLAMCGVNTPCLHLLPRCTTTLASCASTSGIPRASSNHGCHSGSATLHRRAPVVRLSLVQCRQHRLQHMLGLRYQRKQQALRRVKQTHSRLRDFRVLVEHATTCQANHGTHECR